MKSRPVKGTRFREDPGARTLVRFKGRLRRPCGGFRGLRPEGCRSGLKSSLLSSRRRGAGALAAIVLFCFSLRTESAEAAGTNVFRYIDLSPSATPSEALTRQFSALPPGLRTFHGIPFRIGAPIVVTGMEPARNGAFFPTEINVKIGGTGKRIHLLLGTMFADKDGVPVAKLVFHYAGGSAETVRLGYGVQVRDWVVPRLEKHSGLFDPNSQVAWSDADEQQGIGSRLFQTAIENPKPGEAIESIDLVSLFSHAAPFIIAMTVEGEESRLAANRPLPSRKPLRDLRGFPDSAYRGVITVRVTDAASGAPPKDAVVSLGVTDDKETYFFGEAKPDALGVCRMPYPRQHAVGLSVWVHAPERAPFIISESRTNLGKFAESYSVTLKPGMAVGGLVKDTKGDAVQGAQVVIHKITRISPHHYGRVDYDAALTAADGKWSSRSLPDDLSGFSFQVMHPDYRPALFVTAGSAPPPTNSSTMSTTTARRPSVTYRTLPNGTRVPITTRSVATPTARAIPPLDTNALLAGNVEMILQPALLLEGTLVDTGGKPVPSAELIIRDTGGRKYLRTDAKGRFAARVGEPADTAVIVLREGFEPLFRSVNVAPGMAPLEIKLAPARVLHGRVVDRKQLPVSGAQVRLMGWNGASDLLRFQTVTDEQGRFTWTGAPLDQATLYVSKTNFNNTSHSFSGLPDNLVIPISGQPGVYGKVYDAETKKPIESFTVIPGRKYSPGEIPIRWDRSDSGRGSGGEYSLRMSSYYFQPEGRVLVEAPGYEPQISRALNGMDSYACDFSLKKGKGVAGIVVLPDGSPAIGASLLLVEHGESGSLTAAGQLRGNGGDLARSDMQGRFEFNPKLDPEKLFVSHEQGFAEGKVADMMKNGKITLQKWGRVKGLMRVGEKGETEAGVQLQGNSEQTGAGDGRFTGLSFVFRVDPDPDGAFDFDRVPPGEHRLAVEYRFKDDRDGNPPLSHGLQVAVKPGETTETTLGGTGRRVNGRVKVLGGDASDVDWKRDVHQLVLVRPPDPSSPGNGGGGLVQGLLTLFGGLNPAAPQPMRPEAMRARQRAERMYVLLFDTNGNFRVDNVPAGKYVLMLNVTDPDDEYYNRRTIGSLTKETVVPDEPNAKVNAPFDLGTLELTIHPRVKVGEPVPPFEAKTSDGKPIKLSDFRGKPVLLHFWGLSLGWSSYDLEVLKEFQNRYGVAGNLAIIGYNLDADPRGAEAFAKSQGLTWTQTYLGNWNQTPVAGMFGLNGNSVCVLVDAEGKLASSQLRGTAIRTALSNALSVE